MWRKTKNAPAPELDTKEKIVSVETVRRIEVSVEREVCSLTVHGHLALTDQQSCPLCGQRLAAGETTGSDVPTGIDSEMPNDDRRLK